MLATLGRPPAGDEFAVEVKYDGQRGLIVVDDDGLAVFTRNGADVTSLGVDVLRSALCPSQEHQKAFEACTTCVVHGSLL